MEASYALLKHEAVRRSQIVHSPLSYTVGLQLNHSDFSGYIIVDFITKTHSSDLWIDYAGDFIRMARLNTRSLPTSRSGNKLPLGDLPAGPHKLHIEFSSSYSSNGTGLHKFEDPFDGKVYLYSYMCPYYANKVFPCFDQPDLKAVFSFIIDANSLHKVLSNESVQSSEELPDAYTRHTLHPTPPIPTYILAIVCGDFEGESDIYSRGSISQYIPRAEIQQWLAEGYSKYHEYFGIAMPFRKCSQVFCPEFNMGAMENAGCVTINDQHVWKETPVKSEYNWLQNTILHELCHLWFGNYVTLQWWDDLWLNESFATFFSYYIASLRLNPDVWVGFLFNKMRAYAADSLQSTHPVHVDVGDTQEAISNLDNITYWKGASLLKNLAFIIGESAFSEGLKRYFQAYAWKNVCLADFVSSMESPLLHKWVEEWVDQKGLNSIEVQISEDAEKITRASVRQCIVTGDILRGHSLLVEGLDESGSVFKIKVQIPNTPEAEIPELVGFQKVKGLIVNSDDHGYVKVVLDEQSTDFLFKQGKVRTLSTLNRGIAWQSLWNRVENFKTASSGFIEFVSNLLQFEEEEELIDLISSYSLTILNDYCPYEYIAGYSHILYEAISNKLKVSPNNKCLQRKIFLVAHTVEDIAAAYEYSFSLNRSERWKGIMLKACVLEIEAVRGILEEELKYDKNDMSIFLKNYCEAAAVDNKEQMWDVIVNKKGFSMLQIEYAMRGFWQTKDLTCLEAYYDKYFEALPVVIQNFDREYAENFIKMMIPKENNIDRLIGSLRQVDVSRTWVKRIVEDTVQVLENKKRHLENFIAN